MLVIDPMSQRLTVRRTLVAPALFVGNNLHRQHTVRPCATLLLAVHYHNTDKVSQKKKYHNCSALFPILSDYEQLHRLVFRFVHERNSFTRRTKAIQCWTIWATRKEEEEAVYFVEKKRH